MNKKRLYYTNRPKNAEIQAHLSFLESIGKLVKVDGKYQSTDKHRKTDDDIWLKRI